MNIEHDLAVVHWRGAGGRAHSHRNIHKHIEWSWGSWKKVPKLVTTPFVNVPSGVDLKIVSMLGDCMGEAKGECSLGIIAAVFFFFCQNGHDLLVAFIAPPGQPVPLWPADSPGRCLRLVSRPPAPTQSAPSLLQGGPPCTAHSRNLHSDPGLIPHKASRDYSSRFIPAITWLSPFCHSEVPMKLESPLFVPLYFLFSLYFIFCNHAPQSICGWSLIFTECGELLW